VTKSLQSIVDQILLLCGELMDVSVEHNILDLRIWVYTFCLLGVRDSCFVTKSHDFFDPFKDLVPSIELSSKKKQKTFSRVF
jgi:hypothetical protein